MAAVEQIKGLAEAYLAQDERRFRTIVLQVAAAQARQGHDQSARELKRCADEISRRREVAGRSTDLDRFRVAVPRYRLSDLVVPEELEQRIDRIVQEYHGRGLLDCYGYQNRRKILLEGAAGTGKTFTASVIAAELGLPLYVISMDQMDQTDQMDQMAQVAQVAQMARIAQVGQVDQRSQTDQRARLAPHFPGEGRARLGQIFAAIERQGTGVYLFDGWEEISADAGPEDAAEMGRLWNTLLRLIDRDVSESFLMVEVHRPKFTQQVLLRHFDDVLHYPLPGPQEIRRLYETHLGLFDDALVVEEDLVERSQGLSHAEVIRVCDDAIKEAILSGEQLDPRRVAAWAAERRPGDPSD